ncbi:poly-beta-1,6-N-acetyl-D-glucosamine synthase [Ottowia sp.]|uniref:poly-beta-1,6-N-acetyl-D-glucosamine synthase n=1 Tax=Ottowia sp. TaxID=1898956 RepID=UPI003A8A9F83
MSHLGLHEVLVNFVFFYPLLMAYVWMIGGVVHVLRLERRRSHPPDPLKLLPYRPMVTVIVPCYNESGQIREVIAQLMRSRYPRFEVITVNDGSTDDTALVLDALTQSYPGKLRVIHNATNQGKAVGLNTAALLARGEFIFGIDGDALIDEDAIAWLLMPMLANPRVGAVTGNPRIRNRTTLLGRMQVGEFSATIGLIKRTQQLWGRLFTVSGVVVMFRRRALLNVGFWSTDILTEDIDISWRLQLAGWLVRFQPAALSWILMPETVRGLWKQRLRWSMGGVQAIIRYRRIWLNTRLWKMWPVYAEYLLSVIWSYVMLFVLTVAAIIWIAPIEMPTEWRSSLLPGWRGLLLAATCLIQIGIGMWIDRYYDRDLMRYLVWTLWYPIAFWTINMCTAVIAVPKALLWRSGKRATWTSPDRGIGTQP